MAEFEGRAHQTAIRETAAAPVIVPPAEAGAVALHRPLRYDIALKALVLALCCAAASHWLVPRVGPAFAARTLGEAHTRAEHAIFLGGIVLERHRHVIAGGLLGCAAGAAVGGGAAAVTGLFTAGVGFAAIPSASLVGCSLAGAGGAALGYPLDDYLSF